MFSSLLPHPKNCAYETIKISFLSKSNVSSALIVPTTDKLPSAEPNPPQTLKRGEGEVSKITFIHSGLNDIVAEYGKKGVVVQASYEDTIPLKQKYPRLKHLFPRFTLKTCPNDSLKICLNETRRVIDEILFRKEDEEASSETTLVTYTPNTIVDSVARVRTFEIHNFTDDPMMPPKFKLRKNRENEPSSSPPILKAKIGEKMTKAIKDQWHIPSAVSNWKNNQGFAISLDKRVNAASGGSVDNGPSLNLEKFGALSSALESADKQARAELSIRNEKRKQVIIKEQAEKEAMLKMLLARTRQQPSNKRGSDNYGYNRETKRYRGA